MKMIRFAQRNSKEMLRDPLSLAFGIGFPVILLLLLTAMQQNIPVEMFSLTHLTPGMAVFGLAFIALFSATLISKDRATSFMARLLSSPLTGRDFIFGYTLPLLPMSIVQSLICFVVAIVLGMEFTVNIFVCILVLIPCDILFISMGLLFGSILNDKQVGGICGALLTNLTAWLSGTWFDLKLLGNTFSKIAYALPFARSVDAARSALSGDFDSIMGDLWYVIAYAAAVSVLAIMVFNKKMKKGII